MSTHRLPQIKRLQRVRLLEEESEESVLRAQQQLRGQCRKALEDCDASKADASRSLHASLAAGDRDTAMAAEMAMAFDPLRRNSLTHRLAQLDALIEGRTASWRAARMRRRQMDAVVERIETERRGEVLLAEQKSLDGWFLMAGPQLISSDEEPHESFQREAQDAASDSGVRSAKERDGMKVQLQIPNVPPKPGPMSGFADTAAQSGQFQRTLQSALTASDGSHTATAGTTPAAAGAPDVSGSNEHRLGATAEPQPIAPAPAAQASPPPAMLKDRHFALPPSTALGPVGSTASASQTKSKSTGTAQVETASSVSLPQVPNAPPVSVAPAPAATVKGNHGPPAEKRSPSLAVSTSPAATAVATAQAKDPAAPVTAQSDASVPAIGKGDSVPPPGSATPVKGRDPEAPFALQPPRDTNIAEDSATPGETAIGSAAAARSSTELRSKPVADGQRTAPAASQPHAPAGSAGGVSVAAPAVPQDPAIEKRTGDSATSHSVDAASVLARMDAASPVAGAQLRSDARHLEVGIQTASHGWLEVRATSGALGQVDASIQVQTGATAHALTHQTGDIASYVRDQSIHMGELSVGVGTGGRGTRLELPQDEGMREGTKDVADPAAAGERDSLYRSEDAPLQLSMISLRA